MNPNIEKINENLFGVRFDWLRAGFITDSFPLIPKGQLNNPHVMIAVDGVIVLDKDSPLYDSAKSFFSRVMGQSDAQIRKQAAKLEVQKVRQGSKFDVISNFQLGSLKTEQTRRELVKLSKGKSQEQLLRELQAVEKERGREKCEV
jgi:hypothetical protein